MLINKNVVVKGTTNVWMVFGSKYFYSKASQEKMLFPKKLKIYLMYAKEWFFGKKSQILKERNKTD